MPGITLTLSGAPDTALASRLSHELTELTARVLDKQPSQTMVIVRFVDPGLWFIDSESLERLGRNSFRLEVTITDETTTVEQKRQYQREAYDLLSGRIGNVHPIQTSTSSTCAPRLMAMAGCRKVRSCGAETGNSAWRYRTSASRKPSPTSTAPIAASIGRRTFA